MVKVNVKAFQKEGYTFEEIQQVIDAEEEFERTGVCYSVEEVFSNVKKRLFSKQNEEYKCIK